MSKLNIIPIGTLFDLEKGSLQSSKCTEGEYTFITAAQEWKTHNEYSHECEALIFAAAASGSLGRTHYINDKFITSDLCFILTPKDTKKYPINLKFYHFVFNSLKDEIVKNTKSGTSKESINQSNLRNYEIPYFEIDKQNLWINKLVNTKSIKEDLELELSTGQSLLKQLKQTILQEAIEGKLTEKWRAKNPDIGTAKELLSQIKKEKEKLVKDKKLKKSQDIKNIKTIRTLNIPSTWEWAKGDEIFFVTKLAGFEYTEHIKLEDSGDIPVVRAQNVRPFQIKKDSLKYIDIETSLKLERCALTKQALLITFIGAGIGDVALFDEKKRWHLAPNVAKQEIFEGCEDLISLRFINQYLMSNVGREELFKHVKATAQPSLSMGTIRDIDYPIPPIEEQKEIVATIEKLFALCDELESEINQNKTTVDNLMATVLKEAFEN